MLRIGGTIRYETRDARTGAVIPGESGVVHNIVTDVGLAQLAKVLVQAAYTTNFQVAVGTGTNTPAAGDTALQTQVFIALVTSQTFSGAVASYKLFLDTTQANGNTLSEVGLFHNSGLIDHALLSPTIIKTSAKIATIQIDLTLSR